MKLLLALAAVAVTGSVHAATQSGPFVALVDRYFDGYFAMSPTAATAAGVHSHDAELEDFSRGAVDRKIGLLRGFLTDFERLPAAGLSGLERADRDLAINALRAQLLEFEEVRMWRRNPDFYSSGITTSAFLIISRKFAPEEVRLRSLIARERAMPGVLDQARLNLENPPRIYTEIAIEQLPGLGNFFRQDVPAAFAHVTDARLLAEFQAANGGVIKALESYEAWLRKDLLPRSKGDFRLGADRYRRKLLYEEMVDTPLDRLLEIGMADLRRNQREFQAVAARYAPAKPAGQVLADLQKDHPKPANLLADIRGTLTGLRDFIVSHKIVTIPSPVLPIVEETPPFMRALTFASMDTPGPFEKVAKEAFFNITLPEADWSKERVEEHMAGFNRGTIVSTAVHEAYPGHYVQFLWVQQAPSKVRQLIGCGTNAEGWAHYTEQMMLDEGYAKGDDEIRLGQLDDALLRDARYIVGLRMHTGDMTYEQGIDFFVKEGYQTRANAERETKRGTSDPTYLVYTLGKLQIMKLREDYRKARGAAFNLKEFHDRFLGQGFPPVKIVREALLGANAGPVL
jgi:uncharacterized protein (DUF885 family)